MIQSVEPQSISDPVAGARAAASEPLVPVIVDCSAVTPLGSSLNETWDALLAGRCIDCHGRAPLEMAGGLPRVVQLAIHAAGQLDDCQWVAHARELATLRGAIEEEIPEWKWPRNAAVVVGTSKGPVDSWMQRSIPDDWDALETPPVDVAGVGEVADRVASQFGFTGPRLTVSAACASGLHALIRGAMMIRSGEARDVLVVAAESSLHPLFIGSFTRLGVLSHSGACRPFDKSRDGFLMSEAAAAVWLRGIPRDSEWLNPTGGLRRMGWAPCIAVERFALGGDATHLTGGDPAGRVLRQIIDRVVGDDPIDLLHGHATGTEAHDPVELAALDDACRTQLRPPALYSHKAALGHSLGAAGLVSVVINWLAHQRGIVPPNARTRDPLRASHVSIEPGAQTRRIRRSLAVASGFGGATAAVTLKTFRSD